MYPNLNIFVACFTTSWARHLTKGLLSAIFFHTPTEVNMNRLKARSEAPWRIKGFIPSELLRMMEKMERGEGGTPNLSSFVFGFQLNTNPSLFFLVHTTHLSLVLNPIPTLPFCFWSTRLICHWFSTQWHFTFFLYIPEQLNPSHFILHSKQPSKQARMSSKIYGCR